MQLLILGVGLWVSREKTVTKKNAEDYFLAVNHCLGYRFLIDCSQHFSRAVHRDVCSGLH
jgi:hypothetical protein